MSRRATAWGGLALALLAAGAAPGTDPRFTAQNELLFRRLEAVHHLDEAQLRAVRAIFARSGFVGQGNPAIARHPLDEEQCDARLRDAGVAIARPDFERICGAPYMAPLYDPARQTPEDAPACIDQLEFPDIPCAFPVVWVKAREAAPLC